MKSLEIILKISFILLAFALIATGDVINVGLWCFLVTCFGLGVVLIINKKSPSYTYPKKYKYHNRIFAMRRIEGLLLVIFSFAGLLLINMN